MESYFETRLKEAGLDTSSNKIRLTYPEAPGPQTVQILSTDKFDNVHILVYDINGFIRTIPGKKSDGTNNPFKEEPYYVTRLKNPLADAKGKTRKYNIPRGAGTFPFVAPRLLEAYKKGIATPTIYITEGYLKAVCASVHGLPIFGLSSITHHSSKGKAILHEDIILFIDKCKVKNIVVLYDGDFADISLKDFNAQEDIYSRPYGFFKSIETIRERLKDYLTSKEDNQIDLYFAAINTKQIEGNPKGIDDLYNALPDQRPEITKSLLTFNAPSKYLVREHINSSIGKVRSHIGIDTPLNFYHKHQDIIKDKEFIYLGTRYKYNEEKNELDIKIPGASRNYFRVGDTYFENVMVPNKNGEMEKQIHRRLKSTISDDHGDKFLQHIPKYKAFCNVPDHVNYQPVINSCFNSYAPFNHVPEEGDCKLTLEFLTHIFGEQLEMGLDYVQMLYQYPTQVLPILCLVSKQNDTGKSTFAKWLKRIFQQNMTIIGNEELQNQFNASYATRLVICCEESFIDKKVVIEKIKALSTASTITLNAKGKDHVELEFFGKFILLTNNEDDFIYASSEDIRYWVRKVPMVDKSKKRDILADMDEEVPAFLDFLTKRKFHTPNTGSRMFFRAEDLITDALKNVVKNSMRPIEKEIRNKIIAKFLDFGLDELRMTNIAITRDLLNKRFDENYVAKIITENIGAKTFEDEDGKKKVIRYTYPQWQTNGTETKAVLIRDSGRPYVFTPDMFLTVEEIKGMQKNLEILTQDLSPMDLAELQGKHTVKIPDSSFSPFQTEFDTMKNRPNEY